MADGTTIDELVVKIGLDSAGFVSGQKAAVESFKKTRDAATITGKELEARGAQGAEFFGKITTAALELGAVLIGAGSIDKYLSTTIPQITALGRASALLGDSTQDLKAFQLWVQQAGGSSATATGDILKLSQTLQGFRSGLDVNHPGFLAGLSFIGGSINDTPVQIFEKLADFAKTHSGQQTRQFGQMIGFSDDDIALAIQSRGGARAGINAAASQPGVLTDQQVADVTKANTAWQTLKNNIQGVANVAIASAAPSVTHLLGLLNGTEKAATGTDKALVQIGRDVGPLVTDFGRLGAAFQGLFGKGAATEFFTAIDHQIRALDALVRVLTDGLRGAGAALRGDWKGVAAAALAEVGDWKTYGLEQAATLGFGPNATMGSPGGLPTESQNTPSGDHFGGVAAALSGSRAAIASMIRADAIAAGLDPDVMVNAAQRESGLRAAPPANPGSSAGGLFQFLDASAAHYGLTNKNDPSASSKAAMRLVKDDLTEVYRITGKTYTPGDEYLALFLGAGGMARLLGANQNALASSVLPAAAAHNRGYFGHRTVGQLESYVRGLVTIGTINVNAGHATDARGIAKHIKKAIGDAAIQSNSAYN